jgi:iron-sulfur cluster assembly protein
MRLTEKAAQEIKALVEEKGLDPATAGLRLGVEKGGCAGMQYAMSIGSHEEGDTVIAIGGGQLLIDATSLTYLGECTLDFEDGLTGAGFRVINPHATRSCGCGTSFEPASKDSSAV